MYRIKKLIEETEEELEKLNKEKPIDSDIILSLRAMAYEKIRKLVNAMEKDV